MSLPEAEAGRIATGLDAICREELARLDSIESKLRNLQRTWESERGPSALSRDIFNSRRKTQKERLDMVSGALEECKGRRDVYQCLRAACELVEGVAWIAAGSFGRGIGSIKAGVARFCTAANQSFGSCSLAGWFAIEPEVQPIQSALSSLELMPEAQRLTSPIR